MAREAREPPMSMEPSTSVTVPSGLIDAAALELRPALAQKPSETPRPRSFAGGESPLPPGEGKGEGASPNTGAAPSPLPSPRGRGDAASSPTVGIGDVGRSGDR